MIKPKNGSSFPFYPTDFVTDISVASMSNQERGCYITLLCFCWREGSIPNNIKSIARIVGETEEVMNKLWENISPCFVPEGKGKELINRRLELERKKQGGFLSRQSKNGKLGAQRRWAKEGALLDPITTSTSPELVGINVDETTPISLTQTPAQETADPHQVVNKSKLKRPKVSVHIPLPEGVDAIVYADYLIVRGTKPFTSTAFAKFESEAKQAGVSLNEAFSICCHKGWVGFQATWYENLNRQQQAGRPNYPTKGRIEDSMTSEEYRAYVLKELGVGTGAADYVDGDELTEVLTGEGRLPWLSQ